MTPARWLVRVTFLVQLVLGIGLWTGRLDAARGAHILVGLLFVAGLWAVAALGLRAGASRPLGAGLVLWGALVVVLGLTQESILGGGLHWLVQVLHMAVAMVGIALAEALATRTARAGRASA